LTTDNFLNQLDNLRWPSVVRDKLKYSCHFVTAEKRNAFRCGMAVVAFSGITTGKNDGKDNRRLA
jgi:hypothetical protein